MDLKKTFGPIILMFIIIVLAVPFVINVGSNTAAITSQQTSVNETFDISSARNVSLNMINNYTQFSVAFASTASQNHPITGFVLMNLSGSVIGANNYTFNSTTGNFTLLNTTYMVTGGGKFNTTFVNETFYGPNYSDDGGVRAVFSLTNIMFALGIALAVFAYINWDYLMEVLGR